MTVNIEETQWVSPYGRPNVPFQQHQTPGRPTLGHFAGVRDALERRLRTKRWTELLSSSAAASMPPSFPKRVTQRTALPGLLRNFSDCGQRERAQTGLGWHCANTTVRTGFRVAPRPRPSPQDSETEAGGSRLAWTRQ